MNFWLLARRGWASRRVRDTVATNALSSLGNLSLSLAIAREAPLAEVGEFAAAFALLSIGIGIGQAAIVEPTIVSSTDLVSMRLAVRRVLTLALAISLPVGLAGMVLGSSYITIAAVGLPGAALFMLVRVVSLTRSHSGTALLLEFIWTIVTVLAALGCLSGIISPVAVFLLYILSASAMGVTVCIRRGWMRPPPQNVGATSRQTSAAFGLEYLLGSGTAQMTTIALAATAGRDAVGALKGAGTLYGPVTLLLTSLRTVLLPYLSDSAAGVRALNIRLLVRLSMAILPLFLLLVLMVLLLPDSLGSALLADNWRYVKPLLAPLGAELIFAAAAAVPFAVHRALLEARRTLAIRTFLAPIRVGIVLFAASIGGAPGAAVGMATVALVAAIAWWASAATLLCQRNQESR